MVVGTAAVEQPEVLAEWIAALGAERLIVGVDARGGRVATHGWQNVTDLDVLSVLSSAGRTAASSGSCTPMSAATACCAGPMSTARARWPTIVKVIGSGGVVIGRRTCSALAEAGAEGAIIGTALYEGRLKLERRAGGRVLTRRIIPCLDVASGKVIRGVKFSADKIVGDPVELAAEYNRQGADELVFYDITASAEDRGLIMDVLHRAAGEVFIPLTVGGGVRTTDQMRDLLRAGADKVSINSPGGAATRT